jgi:hypothetical protein
MFTDWKSGQHQSATILGRITNESVDHSFNHEKQTKGAK